MAWIMSHPTLMPDGVSALASQYEQYREEVFLLLHEGLDIEVAGSIRARLNKALKMITRNG